MNRRTQLTSLLVVAVVVVAGAAHYYNVDLHAGSIARDCLDLLQDMWKFFTGLFRMT